MVTVIIMKNRMFKNIYGNILRVNCLGKKLTRERIFWVEIFRVGVLLGSFLDANWYI